MPAARAGCLSGRRGGSPSSAAGGTVRAGCPSRRRWDLPSSAAGGPGPGRASACTEQHRLAEAAGLTVCSGHYAPESEWVKPFVTQLADMLAACGARAWVLPGGYTGNTEEQMRTGALL
ncbi:MAG: hypothetical protein JXR77_04970 [Lentisphaeria bacterium]|nr:hypothetical protein [Lentisphaeria bacterium]